MTARKFTDTECLAMLDQIQAKTATASSLSLLYGCSHTTIWAALDRAYAIRPAAADPTVEAPPATPAPCGFCGGPCQNVLVCGRRERAAAQLHGGLLRRNR